MGRSALGDDAAAGLATAGPHVDDVVGVGDHVQVVLDDHDGGAVLDELLQHADERFHVERVQPDGGLVEDEEGVVLAAAHLAGELQALGFAAGKRWRGLAQSEVAQAQIVQDLQLVPHLLQVGERGKRLVNGESEHLGKR